MIVEALTVLKNKTHLLPDDSDLDETIYCSPVIPPEQVAPSPLVPCSCKLGQTFACL